MDSGFLRNDGSGGLFFKVGILLQVPAPAGPLDPQVDSCYDNQHAHEYEDPTDSLDQPLTHGRYENQAQYGDQAAAADPCARSGAAQPELHIN